MHVLIFTGIHTFGVKSENLPFQPRLDKIFLHIRGKLYEKQYLFSNLEDAHHMTQLCSINYNFMHAIYYFHHYINFFRSLDFLYSINFIHTQTLSILGFPLFSDFLYSVDFLHSIDFLHSQTSILLISSIVQISSILRFPLFCRFPPFLDFLQFIDIYKCTSMLNILVFRVW